MADDFWRVHTPESSDNDSDSDTEVKTEHTERNWATYLRLPAALSEPTPEMKAKIQIELTDEKQSVRFMWLVPPGERPALARKYVFLASIAQEKMTTTSLQMMCNLLASFGAVAVVAVKDATPEACTVFC